MNASAFRRRILKLDEATLQDYGLLPAEGGLMKATVVDKSGGDKGTRGGGRRLAGGGQHFPRVEGCSERGKSAAEAGQEDGMEWNEVPFSWVVRGRQERHLVDQQVRLLQARSRAWWQSL